MSNDKEMVSRLRRPESASKNGIGLHGSAHRRAAYDFVVTALNLSLIAVRDALLIESRSG